MRIASWLAAACTAAITLASAGAASAQDCLTGEVKMFAGDFPPTDYMLAQGQLLPIGQYQALFSILGTYYGGNGTSDFALPDLSGRVPIGAGMGRGLNNVNLGQKSGDEWTGGRQVEVAAGNGAAVTGTAPISNMQPSTGLNFIICVSGIYPSRQ
jgi:microcystin-dependent protein